MPTFSKMNWDDPGTPQALTLISNTTVADAAGLQVIALYGRIAPTPGNKNLVISWTGNNEMHASAISFSGVDQTSVAVAFPHGNTHSASGGSSPCTVTITSATGNMVTATHVQNFSAWGVISGTTLAKDDTTGPNSGVASNYANGAASVALTAAFTGTGNNISSGCDVLAAAGGDTFGNNMNVLMMARRRRDPAKILVPAKYRRYVRGFALAA